MLQYFPDSAEGPNYWPNHLFTMLLNTGCSVGDAVDACEPALAIARSGRDASTPEFKRAFTAGFVTLADRLERAAATDENRSRAISAAGKRLRAAALLEAIDWFHWPWGSDDPSRQGAFFHRARAAARQAIPAARGPHAGAQWVQIPFEGHSLEGLFVPARLPMPRAAPSPVVLHLNGQHSSLHWHYQMGLPAILAERGIASLLFDHPGVGSARYQLGLKVRADTESYAGAAIDFLELRTDIDPSRIGVLGGSLGGYRAPRAAAFDDRVRAVVVWGAHYDMYDSVITDWPGVGRKLPAGGPFTADEEEIVRGLHFWTGTRTLPELDSAIRALSLDGVLGRIKVPLLVVHGIEDRQLPRWHAERTVTEAVNSPRAELLIVTAEMGGSQHCNWDNPQHALCAMGDWLADVLQA